MIVEVYRTRAGWPTFERQSTEPTAIEVPTGSRIRATPLGTLLFSPTTADPLVFGWKTASELLKESQKGDRFRLVEHAHR